MNFKKYYYGITLWKRFFKEENIPPTEKFTLNGLFCEPYFPVRISKPITEENIGSPIDVPLTPSTFSGTPTLAGSLRYSRARSTSHLIFAAHPVRIAPSGSIPSRPTFLSSIFT